MSRPTIPTHLVQRRICAVLALAVAVAPLCTCTFPDVGYGGSGAASGTSSSSGCASAVLADCGCPDHCALPNASASCSGGACAIDTCAPQFADCNHFRGDGCEVDLHQDDLHCGACGTVCVAPKRCKTGKCK